MECSTRCPYTDDKKSPYFTGMSSPVLFVASLSAVAFAGIVAGAAVLAAIQAFFFFVLPLASAGLGAFLIAAPDVTPLGEEAAVQLLVRAVGALCLAYAGGAMLVGSSRCPVARSLHLALMTAVFGALAVATAGDEGVLPLEVRDFAMHACVKLSLGSAVGSISSALAPSVTKKIQAGKPGSPRSVMCG